MPGFEPMFESEGPVFEPHAFGEPDQEGFASWQDTGFYGEEEAPEVEPEPVDLEALAKEAFELGKQEAQKELQEAHDALDAEREAMKSLGTELAELRRQLVARTASEVGDVVLAVARRVVGDALALHPEALANVVSGALEQLPLEDELTVRVRPEAVEAIRGNLGEREGLAVVSDDTVTEGAVVETRYGRVEATLDTAMAGIEEAVRAWQEDHGA